MGVCSKLDSHWYCSCGSRGRDSSGSIEVTDASSGVLKTLGIHLIAIDWIPLFLFQDVFDFL